ncbi:FAD binding domain-containing protein [Colletotrichum karsti]|uniref:FAD binding domain-containing protein n=1 Tax=Colletotrichum karsti TaxID=1095194 RepID=A0A9P6LLQ8_9PEZI|nr:FAD binding domain-containing protein [Colletotrichum karsti]KAF9877500.1 FAD binding domain-containing protein [Colletotrichum karsti]
MSKLLTVFGATGNQGGSVVRTVLADAILSKQFKIRGISRDASKPAAQALIAKGVEVVAADMTSKSSLAEAIKGSDTVFLVTTPDFMAGGGTQEQLHGKNVADVAAEAGVNHLIYSSLLHVTNTTNGRLKHVVHFDDKAEVEQYIRSKGIPSTFVLPGYFMSNFTALQMIRKGDDGVYTLSYPVSDQARFPLIDTESDVGKFVVAAIRNKSTVIGKQVLAAAEYYTPTRIVSGFQEVTGKAARFVPIDAETYKSFLPGPLADEMLENHLFIEEPGYYAGKDLKESLDLLAGVGLKATSWKEFLEANKSAFHAARSTRPAEIAQDVKRILDLELLHHYTVSTAPTLSGDPVTRNYFLVGVPQLGFSHPYVLYSVLALAASHLAHFRPESRQYYYAHSKARHNMATSMAAPLLSNISITNLIPMHSFSIMTLFIAFANLRDEEDDSNEFLPSWLPLFRGVRTVLQSNNGAIYTSPISYLFYSVKVNEIWQTKISDVEALVDFQGYIEESTPEDDPTRELLLNAFQDLRRALVVYYGEDLGNEAKVKAFFTWLYKIPDEFLALLRNKNNKALSGTAAMLLSMLLADGVQGQPLNNTQGVTLTGFPPCDALITANLSHAVYLPASPRYNELVETYWSLNSRRRPWCFVLPGNTDEVSQTINALRDAGDGAGDWHIAIRSGAHSTDNSNNIVEGITIDLSQLNATVYNEKTTHASVGTGARWLSVFSELETHGRFATGGREGAVGVGGFLLGGGVSWYSQRTGFGCDSVVNYEVVLASGDVINANATVNSDLYRALKGGGNNFGVVTRFDIETFPFTNVTLETRSISGEYANEVADAIADFPNHDQSLADNAFIGMLSYSPKSEVKGINFQVTNINTLGRSNTTAYDAINRIPTLAPSTKATISPIVAANSSSVAAATRNVGAGSMMIATDARVVRYAIEQHAALVESLNATLGAQNFSTLMDFQPHPAYIAEIGAQKGGNVLGLDQSPKNRLMMVSAITLYSDKTEEDYPAAFQLLAAMKERILAFSRSVGKGEEFKYMNYGDAIQDVLGSYGPENVDRIRCAAKKYDPEGFFQHRVPGGFKIDRVA